MTRDIGQRLPARGPGGFLTLEDVLELALVRPAELVHRFEVQRPPNSKLEFARQRSIRGSRVLWSPVPVRLVRAWSSGQLT